jgi:hypothetical protein
MRRPYPTLVTAAGQHCPVRARRACDGAAETGRDDVDSGEACLPTVQGTADVADHPLRRRLRHLGARFARRHPSVTRRRRPPAGTPGAAALTGQNPGGPHERRVRLPRLPHPVETQERIEQVVRLHLHRRPAYPVGESEDSCPDTQDIAVGSRAPPDQAWSDHARMGQLLQTRSGEIDLQQTGHLHLVETRPHAAGPPPLELGPTPPPPNHPHRAVADRSGRD